MNGTALQVTGFTKSAEFGPVLEPDLTGFYENKLFLKIKIFKMTKLAFFNGIFLFTFSQRDYNTSSKI